MARAVRGQHRGAPQRTADGDAPVQALGDVSADSELKLESARPGVISNHIFSRASNKRRHRSFLPVSTKQQSRLKYSHSLMSIPLEGLICKTITT